MTPVETGAAAAPHAGLRYRRDIDGLRAVAVLPVVLFHAGVSGLSGGFVGVDVFFVISGFLISGIMYREMREKRFSLLVFYQRRARRILPNLLAMLAIATLVAGVLLIPLDLYGYAQSMVAALAFCANVFFWLKTNYFAANSQQLPLLHTWSLGVEEQYYLFFPLLLLGALRLPVRLFAPVLWAVLFASFGWSIWQVGAQPVAAFYLPFSRLWELMIGTMLAVGAVPAVKARVVREIMAAAGLALIAAAVFRFDDLTPFPGAAALLPCLGAAFILHGNAQGPTIVKRVLSARLPVFVGLISYSLYIWHWPIMVFTRYAMQRALTPGEIALLLAVTIAIATTAWWTIERPLRRPSVRIRPLLLGVLAGTLAVCAAAAAILVGRGLPQRYAPVARAVALASNDTNPLRSACDNPSIGRIRGGDVCTIGAINTPPSFAVLGDSFGDAILPAIVAAANDVGRAGLVLTTSGCAPLPGVDERGGRCAERIAASYAAIARNPAIDRVLLVGRWPALVSGDRFGLFHGQRVRLLDGSAEAAPWLDNEAAPWLDNEAVVEAGLRRAVRSLSPRRVVAITGLPEQAVHVPQAASIRLRFGGDLQGLPRSAYDGRQAAARFMFARLHRQTGLALLDAGKAMCDARFCPILEKGRALYVDDNHPSTFGAMRLRDPLARALGPTPESGTR